MWEKGVLTSLLSLRSSIAQATILVPLCYAVTSSVLGGFGHAHQRRPEGATMKLVADFGY